MAKANGCRGTRRDSLSRGANRITHIISPPGPREGPGQSKKQRGVEDTAPYSRRLYGAVAQMGEQLVSNQRAAGSNPVRASNGATGWPQGM